jgi:hypothetical protein
VYQVHQASGAAPEYALQYPYCTQPILYTAHTVVHSQPAQTHSGQVLIAHPLSTLPAHLLITPYVNSGKQPTCSNIFLGWSGWLIQACMSSRWSRSASGCLASACDRPDRTNTCPLLHTGSDGGRCISPHMLQPTNKHTYLTWQREQRHRKPYCCLNLACRAGAGVPAYKHTVAILSMFVTSCIDPVSNCRCLHCCLDLSRCPRNTSAISDNELLQGVHRVWTGCGQSSRELNKPHGVCQRCSTEM